MDAAISPVTIVDGNNLLWRYASVMPTWKSAVEQFLRVIIQQTSIPESGEIVIVTEPAIKERDGDYKGNRKEVPDQVVQTINVAVSILSHWMFSHTHVPESSEGDVVIAQYVKEARSHGRSVRVITSDKDMCQLVTDDTPTVKVVHPCGSWPGFGVKDVIAKYGVPPRRIAELLALSGDKSDNIPPVRGWGRITAAKLLVKLPEDTSLSSLEELPYDFPATVPQKVAYKEGRSQLLESLRKTTLNGDPAQWPRPAPNKSSAELAANGVSIPGIWPTSRPSRLPRNLTRGIYLV